MVDFLDRNSFLAIGIVMAIKSGFRATREFELKHGLELPEYLKVLRGNVDDDLELKLLVNKFIKERL